MRPDPVTKFCPYCLREHGRRARACSDWCERKIRGKTAYVTLSRRQAVAKVIARAQKRVRFVPQWRQLAMGAEPAEILQAVFGAKPTDAAIRHGETIDS